MLKARDTKMVKTLFMPSRNGKTHKPTVTMQCDYFVCVRAHISDKNDNVYLKCRG